MQRLAIIGSTGMTGQCVVDYALEKDGRESTLPDGFEDKVIHNPSFDFILSINSRLVEIVLIWKIRNTRESIYLKTICRYILGKRNKLGGTTDLSAGTTNLIKAMKEGKICKIS
ncbi:uncharacterized protein [Eurosta solidaginis]|uniref:uncharacterized protein n=1 Tax=Eurosta solidaginis TaxID=178769 RepID=UPI0035311D78